MRILSLLNKALGSKLEFLLYDSTNIRHHHIKRQNRPIYQRPPRVAKILFSVVCVCQSVQSGGPTTGPQPPPLWGPCPQDMFNFDLTVQPPPHVQTCSLCSPYFSKRAVGIRLKCFLVRWDLKTSRFLELCILRKEPITPNLLGFSVFGVHIFKMFSNQICWVYIKEVSCQEIKSQQKQV